MRMTALKSLEECEHCRSVPPDEGGSMDVACMLKHLRLSAELTLGDQLVTDAKKRAFQVLPLKHRILYVLPVL
jgi:hypothetical protein